MLTLSAKTARPIMADIETRELTDQLLVLLSDNQIFLNKVQKAQWNHNILSTDHYDHVTNQLFNCAEKIALQLKSINGFVPADMELYLSLSDIEENLNLQNKHQMVKDLLASHKTLMTDLVHFSKDEDTMTEKKEVLMSYLKSSHQKITEILSILTL